MAAWNSFIPIEGQWLADQECNQDIVDEEKNTHHHAYIAKLAEPWIPKDADVEIKYRDLHRCKSRNPKRLESNEDL